MKKQGIVWTKCLDSLKKFMVIIWFIGFIKMCLDEWSRMKNQTSNNEY